MQIKRPGILYHLKTFPLLVLYFLVFNIAQKTYAEGLSLEKFRSQAISNDPAYEGLSIQKDGANKTLAAADALTDSRIFLDLYDYDDHRKQQNPNFQGTRINNRSLSLGLMKQMDWGPSFKISQNVVHSTTFDSSVSAIPEPNYFQYFTELQLSMPLWRNLLGVETKAGLQMAKADQNIKRYSIDLQWLKKNGEIDMAYYTHAANQESVLIQRDLVDRAKRILSWANQQKSRGLMDVTDVYQAQAAVTLRQLELENLENELVNSARRFNDLRGQEGDSVLEVLNSTQLDLRSLNIPVTPSKIRRDKVIENEQLNLVQQDYINLREQASPSLDLVFKMNRDGREVEFSDAQSTYGSDPKSMYYVGINFSMPLNAPKYNRIRKGLSQLSRGQELVKKSKDRDDITDWKTFVDSGLVLAKKIEMLRALESNQKLKAEAERVRLQRGRSTTFQVLTFEQDYSTARSQRILAELAARQYLTQIPMFE